MLSLRQSFKRLWGLPLSVRCSEELRGKADQDTVNSFVPSRFIFLPSLTCFISCMVDMLDPVGSLVLCLLGCLSVEIGGQYQTKKRVKSEFWVLILLTHICEWDSDCIYKPKVTATVTHMIVTCLSLSLGPVTTPTHTVGWWSTLQILVIGTSLSLMLSLHPAYTSVNSLFVKLHPS